MRLDPRTAHLAVFNQLRPMTAEEEVEAERYFEELRRINDDWARRCFKDFVNARHVPSD